jgi:hypothetical protein
LQVGRAIALELTQHEDGRGVLLLRPQHDGRPVVERHGVHAAAAAVCPGSHAPDPLLLCLLSLSTCLAIGRGRRSRCCYGRNTCLAGD